MKVGIMIKRERLVSFLLEDNKIIVDSNKEQLKGLGTARLVSLIKSLELVKGELSQPEDISNVVRDLRASSAVLSISPKAEGDGYDVMLSRKAVAKMGRDELYELADCIESVVNEVTAIQNNN